MNSQRSLRGRTALVTGASSGLGRDFATQLAQRGGDVVLVARREDRLRALGDDLARRYGVRVHVLPADLTLEDAPQRLYDGTRELRLTVDVLVNNAGLGLHGPFAEVPWECERAMLQVDVIAIVHLTKLFLKDMVERNGGHVLLVSSNMAYQAGPSYATYAAAKSFLLLFGEAINYELRGTNVKISVLAPGMTRTEFHDVSGQRPTVWQRLVAMPSSTVARIGIEGMLKGRPSVVAGPINSLMAQSVRLLPRRLATAAAGMMAGNRAR